MLLDILFPKRCLNCGKEGKYLCQECSLFLSELPDIELEGFEQVTCCWEHNGIIKKIIQEGKKGAFDMLREMAEKALSEREADLPEDLFITFVPQNEKEEKAKGFNHAEVIALTMGKIAKRKVVSLLESDLCKKQEGDRRERIMNVRGKFRIKRGLIPQKVLLVDDFLVSGATMAECCRTLKENGAKKVWGFTLTRVS